MLGKIRRACWSIYTFTPAGDPPIYSESSDVDTRKSYTLLVVEKITGYEAN